MAQAGPKPSAFYVERQAQTRSPATPTAVVLETNGVRYPLSSLAAYGQTDPGPGTTRGGDGLALAGLGAVTVSLWPNSGQTITAGTLVAWLWSPYMAGGAGQWMRAPDLDLSITAGTYTGPLGYVFQALPVAGREGWLLNYFAFSVTGSSTDFLLRIDGMQAFSGLYS